MPKLNSGSRYYPIITALTALAFYFLLVITISLILVSPPVRAGVLKYFWTIDTQIPDEFITRNFSLTHILCLITTILCITAALFVFRTQSEMNKKRILQVLVILMVGSEIIDWTWYLVIGHYSLRSCLPLHLCSFSIFIEFAAVFSRRSVLLKEFTYSLSMPAALAALITPGWYYPIISFQYLQSLLTHSFLILIPVLLVWGTGFRPNYMRLPKCFLILLLLTGIAASANAVFGGNYMFLSFVPQDTALQVFEQWFGHPGYILPVIILIFIIWFCLYLPWILADRKRRRKTVEKT